MQKLYKKIQSIKNCDFVQYRGCQLWKPNRNFSEFKLTYKDLNVDESELKSLKNIVQKSWHFCDTLLIYSAQENDQFVLDYCLIGQRMNWNVGDQYWLVYNLAKNRFQIRKADYKKWTPLEKMYVNENLQLRFNLYMLKTIFPTTNKKHIETIKQISVNSFPERIQLKILRNTKFFLNNSQILSYYFYNSSFCKNGKNQQAEQDLSFDNIILIKELTDKIPSYNQFEIRKYNIQDESNNENIQDVYNIFLKYSHQLKVIQKSFAKNNQISLKTDEQKAKDFLFSYWCDKINDFNRQYQYKGLYQADEKFINTNMHYNNFKSFDDNSYFDSIKIIKIFRSIPINKINNLQFCKKVVNEIIDQQSTIFNTALKKLVNVNVIYINKLLIEKNNNLFELNIKIGIIGQLR